MMTKNEAASWLLAHDRFTILTHRNPDGDTIGSAVALCHALRGRGKQAHLLTNEQFTARYDDFLSGLVAQEPDETVISVDIASESLLPRNAAPLAGKIQLAVDHHGSNSGFAAHTLLDASAAACGEIIYELILALDADISREIAQALYLAISTDTGCFQFSNVTAATFRIAAALKDAGCDSYGINQIFFGTKTISRLHLEARLTETMQLLSGGMLAICRLPLAWMAELGLDEDSLDSISGFPRAIEGVKIGVMVRELADGSHKISLRTGTEYNASDICAHLDGGGHSAAAGATVKGDYDATCAALLDAIRAEGIEVS